MGTLTGEAGGGGVFNVICQIQETAMSLFAIFIIPMSILELSNAAC